MLWIDWLQGMRTIVGAVGAIVGRKVGLSVLPARRPTDVGLPHTRRAAYLAPRGEGGPSTYVDIIRMV